MVSPSFSSLTLMEYPGVRVRESDFEAVLKRCLERGRNVLSLASRYAGREFCTPGRRLRLKPKSLYPERLMGQAKPIGLDEWWGCCVIPICTGAVDRATGKAPFREGEAHVYTVDGELVLFQAMIEAAPEIMIGRELADKMRAQYGKPTWPIVSKRFDNKNPIPHHLHWPGKPEVHDVHQWDNPGVNAGSHHFTTAWGLFPWVTPEMFLACMRRWDAPEGNGILDLAPHVRIPIGKGVWKCPEMMLHAPAELNTHEVHALQDQHMLVESRTLDGYISPEGAFFACPPEQYPVEKRGNWNYLTSVMDFALNQDPNSVRDCFCPNRPAPEFCSDGVDAYWALSGPCPGGLECSILRLVLQPKAKTSLHLPAPAFFHLNHGRGRVGGLARYYAKEIDLGTVAPENGFITAAAVADSRGVQFANTGTTPFVLTLDFPVCAAAV